LSNGESQFGLVANYLKTIDEVINDAEAVGVNRLAVKYLLYRLSDLRQRKGLEVDINDIKRKAKTDAYSDGVSINDGEINAAFDFLRESLILATFKFKTPEQRVRDCQNLSGNDRKEEGGEVKSLAKVFFTDPRYILGAYLKRKAEEEPEHHVQTFKEIREHILRTSSLQNDGDSSLQKKNDSDWVSHYFEGVALVNIALGIYATNASTHKQKYPEKFDKYVYYVKFPLRDHQDSYEIDGAFKN
jgi:hypothetical protein